MTSNAAHQIRAIKKTRERKKRIHSYSSTETTIMHIIKKNKTQSRKTTKREGVQQQRKIMSKDEMTKEKQFKHVHGNVTIKILTTLLSLNIFVCV